MHDQIAGANPTVRGDDARNAVAVEVPRGDACVVLAEVPRERAGGRRFEREGVAPAPERAAGVADVRRECERRRAAGIF